MRVKFSANYDHKWPSRAMTLFPAGYEGPVKREVGERAIAKGKATEVKHRGKPEVNGETPAISNSRRGRRVAGSDDAPDVGAVVLDPQMDGGR
jgi:hypothetical protein